MSTNNYKRQVRRKQSSKKIIRQRMLYAAGLGLIPIPIVDAAGILSVQVLMIKDISKIYRIPFKNHIVKSLVGSLVGSVGLIGGVKAIPVIGSVLGAATVSVSAAAATYAIGNVFAQHFAQGGTLLDFDPVKSRAHFQDLFAQGEVKAKEFSDKRLKNKSSKAVALPNNSSSDNGQQQPAIASKTIKKEDPLAKIKRIRVLKEKRRKLLKAKKRKVTIRKWIGSFLMFSIASFLVWQFYLKEKLQHSSMSTEIDLYMQETAAKKYQLKPTGKVSASEDATITNYSSNSTEGVIAEYVQHPDATYPKRYSLSAVRFTGSSEKLSSGAEQQLSNIALLMKKYPELLVNLYGHTTGVGPKFNRQRMGRERARVLKEIFSNNGIPSFRITGNYIEKVTGTHDEYWGAEIVIDISTIESVVDVKPPTILSPSSSATGFVKSFRETINPTEASKETTIDPLQTSEREIVADTSMTSATDTLEQEIDSTMIDSTMIDSTMIDSTMIDSTMIDSTMIDSLETDTTKEETPTDLAEEEVLEESKPEPEKTPRRFHNTEGVLLQYLLKPDAVFPKLFSLSEVQFEGKSTTMTNGNKQLQNISELMKEFPNMKIDVYGHTAGAETEEEKIQLEWQEIGLQRAMAIKKVLNNNGIAKRRITTKARRQRRAITEKYWRGEIIIKNK